MPRVKVMRDPRRMLIALAALGVAAVGFGVGCGPAPLAPVGGECGPDMGACGDAGGEPMPWINHRENNTTEPPEGENNPPNNPPQDNNTQGPNNTTPPEEVIDDGCTIGAVECVSVTHEKKCVDNGSGGALWSNMSYCKSGACSSVTDSCCPEEGACQNDGRTRCSNGQVVTCEMTDGCLQWSPPQACPEAGQVCGGNGQCVDTCESNCDGPGDDECDESGAAKICQQVEPECFQYSTESCGSGSSCQGGECVADCQSSCSNAGWKRCQSGTEQTCQDTNGCLQWTDTGSCPTGDGCQSSTLGGTVPSGTCLQNAPSNSYPGCGGTLGCLWARCENGSWNYQCSPARSPGACQGYNENAQAACGN